MGWPRLLVLVRHAESEGNVLTIDERAGYELSTAAYPLTERGREQAQITGEFLKETYGKFDRYYTSYYERSRETMKIMFPDVKPYEDPRLAEGQRGIYHTMTHEEITKLFPHELERRRREGYYHYRPWGGENWADIELRIHSFLGTLNRDYDDETVCMVVHGHWLILLRRLIQHFSIEEAERMYRASVVPNASVTVYEDRTVGGRSRLQLTAEAVVPWRGLLEETPAVR
jgi:probable phosphoglycerate mutase